MNNKAKLQIYTASNDYFVATITIGDKGYYICCDKGYYICCDKGYYICCDRREDMTGRIPQLTQWTSTRRTLHNAVTRSTERGEYYAKIVSGYITINRTDITRDKLRGESSVAVVNKAAGYLASKLGWNFPQTLSL